MSKNVVDMTLRANMDVSQISSGISQIQGVLKTLKLPAEMQKQFNQLLGNATSDLEKYQQKLNSGFKTKGDITGIEKAGNALKASISKIENEWSKLQEMDMTKLARLDPSAEAKIKQLENNFKNLGVELQNKVQPNLAKITEEINKLTTASSKKAGGNISELLGAGQFEQASKELDKYIAKQERVLKSTGKRKADEQGNIGYDDSDARTTSLRNTLKIYQDIKTEINSILQASSQYNQSVQGLNSDRMQIMADATQKANTQLQQGTNTLGKISSEANRFTSSMEQSARKTVELGSDLDMLKSRVQYFFSLTNGAMLFRRILQDTINTTKELDAAMTETAVVTEFDVGDMWEELPRYTNEAKKLGATIQGVYETMTLYYQQGLESNEVFEVGRETLKMARIAGLDYAKATDYMTAALRGFNMEVNEMNAQKINDVYSNLAAITAADTEEIATAMTKTASIASSANMEFETTAAFLSQIIETTRESAETAGTAMKTVIARFTELKKDPAEIGEVDGEIVDANKIETALRTINVALRDTSGQFRDLDDVFLDIAEKWDGLDTNTQRYIATMAAGSRQQSRFIAMMSDYGRTMELVSAANNSAGASQKQFDKTLESLEAKLNNLKNAWDQFTMGIANNTIIKAGIDALTGFLNLINKLTEKLPGATKGIANLFLMIGGFAAGKKIFDAFVASTLTNVAAFTKGGAAAGTAYGVGFGSALKAEFGKTGNRISKLISKKTWINAGGQIGANIRQQKEDALLGPQMGLKREIRAGKKAGMSTADLDERRLQLIALQKEEAAYAANREIFSKASHSQQSSYLALLQAQIPSDAARLALLKDLTEEEWEEFAVQSLLNGTNKKKSDLTKAEIAERATLLKQQQAEIAADKMGLATKAKNLAMLLFGNKATREKAMANFTAAGATWAQKGAQDGLNASMLACPIGWIVLGITALVAGLVLLAKWSEKQTLSYKMQEAAEATEKAKQAAENAKQAYEDLNSSIEEIGTKEDELEKLTYGTIEWQKALLDVNQQIMDLIDRFPELREELLNELQVDANGRLTLSDKGYNLIKERSLEQYKNAVAGQTVSATYEASLQKKQAENQWNATNFYMQAVDDSGQAIMKKTIVRVGNFALNVLAAFTAALGGQTVSGEQALDWNKSWSDPRVTRTATEEEKEQIYNKYLANPEIFVEGNDDLEDFARSLGLASDEILKFLPAMRKRHKADLEYEASVRAQAKQLLLSNTSEDFKAKENSSGIADAFSEFYAKAQETDIENEIEIGKTKKVSEYAQDFGIDNFIDQGGELQNLRKLYQELTGATKEQVEEMFGESTESLRRALASIKVGKDWGKKVENFATELDKFAKGLGNTAMADLMKGIFGGADGTGLTRGDIDTYRGDEDTAAAKLEEFYNQLPKELQDQFGSLEKFIEYYEQQVTDAEGIFNNATAKMDAYGIDASAIPGNLSAGGLKGLSDHLVEIANTTSVDNANAIAETLGSITKGMSEAEMESFYSQLNALDWSSIQSIDGLKHTLQELGIYVPEARLKTLTDQMKEFGKASNAVDLSQLTEQLTSIQNLIDDISSRERGDYTFSEEDKNKIVDTKLVDADMFVGYGDSWRYVGDNLDVLIDALHQNTIAILNDTKGELEDQVKTAKFANKAVTEDKVDYSDVATKTTSEKQEILQDTLDYINDYNANVTNEDDKITSIDGYSLEALAAIANTKDLEDSQVEFLDTILQSLADKSSAEALERLESQYASANREAGILNYLNQSTSAIVDAATATVDPTKGNAAEQQTEIDNATNALLYKARAYAELDDEVRAYNDALATNNEELINEAKKTLAAQLAIEEKAKALDDLDDKVEEHLEALKEINKDTDAYDEQLADLTEDLNDAFGVDLDSTFLSDNGYENLTLLEQAIKGSQSAWDQLLINMQKVQLENQNFRNDFGLTAEHVQNVAAALDGVIFDAEGRADMTQVVTALYSAGKSAEDVAEILNLLGYTDLKFSTDYETITLPDGSTVQVPKQVTATNVNVPAARRSSSFGSGGKNSGSKGGGGGSSNKWENPYDSFYNINSDINDVLEKRNKLEQEYDLLTQNENATIEDYLKNYEERIGLYKSEIALAEQALKMRQDERASLLSKNSKYSKYAWIDENGEVKINFELLNKVTDEEKGQEIEDYIGELENNVEETKNLEETINENTLAIENLMDEWRDTAASFEERVFDALVWEREQQLEAMENAADVIEESNSELIGAIQDEIEQRRQDRDNQKTEKDLAEKQRRLSFLRQDTSGAYAQEILSLEKELGEEQEDYTDTLIDQKIEELEKQNDEAAKQREKQIKLAEYQLENDKKNGAIAQQTKQLLNDATSSAGWNKVWKLLERSEGFKGLTDTNKAVWVEKTQTEFKQAMAYFANGGFTTDIKNNNSSGYYYTTPTTGGGSDGDGSGGGGSGGGGGSSWQSYSTIIEAMDSTGKKGKYYKVGSTWYKEDQISSTDLINKKVKLIEDPIATTTGLYELQSSSLYRNYFTDEDSDVVAKKAQATNIKINGIKYFKLPNKNNIYFRYSDDNKNTYNDLDDIFVDKKIKGEPMGTTIASNKLSQLKFIKAYKTGGLADFTGPAWLDGTKSKPELVLNQKDTQNFLQLKDILGSFMKNRSSVSSQTVGDTNYEISITVEKMTSDYDVDQVASKIKQIINNDARYRNSNIINRLR